MKHDDTHDELVKTYLKYFSVSELFERRPSVRNSRAARRELRKLITLAKTRQDEIRQKHLQHLEEWREERGTDQDRD